MAKHLWVSSKLNHGNYQCERCGCTDLEARFAIGQECPKGESQEAKAKRLEHPYKPPKPLSEKGRWLLAGNLERLWMTTRNRIES